MGTAVSQLNSVRVRVLVQPKSSTIPAAVSREELGNMSSYHQEYTIVLRELPYQLAVLAGSRFLRLSEILLDGPKYAWVLNNIIRHFTVVAYH